MLWALAPLLAGLFAPVLSTIGLFVWADRWRGSALGLNAFKGCFAALFHGGLALATTASFARAYTPRAVSYMLLSSLLGIVVSDTWWLVALARLGARRMIAIDAVKPFLAAAFGAALLGDEIRPAGYVGVAVSALGVLLVNHERTKEKMPASDDAGGGDAFAAADDGGSEAPSADAVGGETAEGGRAAARQLELVVLHGDEDERGTPDGSGDGRAARGIDRMDWRAYGYALGNVVLDVYAATLTVRTTRATETSQLVRAENNQTTIPTRGSPPAPPPATPECNRSSNCSELEDPPPPEYNTGRVARRPLNGRRQPAPLRIRRRRARARCPAARFGGARDRRGPAARRRRRRARRLRARGRSARRRRRDERRRATRRGEPRRCELVRPDDARGDGPERLDRRRVGRGVRHGAQPAHHDVGHVRAASRDGGDARKPFARLGVADRQGPRRGRESGRVRGRRARLCRGRNARRVAAKQAKTSLVRRLSTQGTKEVLA